MTDDPIVVRAFCAGEEEALWVLFHDAVHTLTLDHYSQAQRDAWAPAEHDLVAWAVRLQRNQPFVAEIGGVRAGFGDLQANGLIDHFFVAREFARRGVACALMQCIHESAADRGITRLHADVSLAAQPFFARCGFVIIRRQQVQRGSVTLENARMEKGMDCGSSPQ